MAGAGPYPLAAQDQTNVAPCGYTAPVPYNAEVNQAARLSHMLTRLRAATDLDLLGGNLRRGGEVRSERIRTTVAGEGGVAILEMSPRQARTLHRLVAEYNIGAERTGSSAGRCEPNLEDALLRLISRFLNE